MGLIATGGAMAAEKIQWSPLVHCWKMINGLFRKTTLTKTNLPLVTKMTLTPHTTNVSFPCPWGQIFSVWSDVFTF
jgi:hypothetical protein